MATSLRRRVAAALFALLLAAPAACGSDPTGPRVGDIVVQPSPLTLRQREAHRLQVSVTDARGTLLAGVAVVFASSDPRIVTVSGLGEVTSVGPAGSTTIRVSAGDFSKSVPVTVIGVGAGLRVTPSPATVAQLGSVQLDAKVIDLAGDAMAGQPMEYVSLAPELVQVDPGGRVTSVGRHGTGSVAVRSGLFADTVAVTVTQVASGVRVAPASALLAVGRSVRLRPTVVDAIGEEMPSAGVTFAFTSANPAVASVEADGTVRAGATLGETSIEVRGGGTTVSVPVRVVSEVPRPAGEVVGRIPMPGAWGVAFAAGGTPYAVTTEWGLFRLDADALTATQLTGESFGLDLAITEDGARAYVANQAMMRVDLVELATGAVLRSSPGLGTGALTDLLSADGQTLWVGTGGGVFALDATTLAILQTIPAGSVVHLARHPTLPRLYASDNYDTVHEIDLTTRTLLRSFTVRGWLQGVAVAPGGGELYVANEYGAVQVLDLATGVPIGEIGTGTPSALGGYGMAIGVDGLRLYVSLTGSGKVAIIDPVARTVERLVDVGGAPRRLALSPAGDLLLVALESGEVVVIR